MNEMLTLKMTWDEAMEYAKQNGKRLLTDREFGLKKLSNGKRLIFGKKFHNKTFWTSTMPNASLNCYEYIPVTTLALVAYVPVPINKNIIMPNNVVGRMTRPQWLKMKNAPKTSGTSKEEKHYVFLVDNV